MSYYIGEIVRLRAELINAHKKGDYLEAYTLAEDIVKKYEDNNDTESIEYASDIYNFGVLNDDINNYKKAIECYRKSADIRKKYNPKSNEYANTINNLAIDLSMTKKSKEALNLLKEVLAIREKNVGTSHIDYILSLYNIGNVYEDMGDFDSAIDYLRRALVKAQRKDDFPKNDYADILLSLGRCYDKKGNYKESIKNYVGAIEVIELNLDKESFYYMTALMSVSRVCEKCKFYERAIGYSEKALNVREKLIEKTHLDYITSINGLASLYSKIGNYEKSMEIHREALEVVKEMFGENHSFYADALNNIGIDYSDMGRFDEALKYHEMAIESKKETMGENSPNIAVTYVSLGNVYAKMNDRDKALEFYNKALEIREKNYGEGSLFYIEVLNTVASFYYDIKDYEKASDYYMKAMMIRATLTDKKSVGYVKNLMDMAECVGKAGRYEEALDMLDDGLNIRRKIYGEKHPKYSDTLMVKATILMGEKRYDEARDILEEVVIIRDDMIGTGSVDHRSALSLYADCCRLSGKYDEAISTYNQSIDLNPCETYEDNEKCNKEKLKEALALLQSGDIKKGNMYFKKAVNGYGRDNIKKDEEVYEMAIECAKLNISGKYFEQALKIVEECESIGIEVFGNKAKLYKVYSLKSYVLLELSRYDEAIDNINSYLKEVGGVIDNDEEMARIYITLSNLYSKKNDKENLVYSLLKARKVAKGNDYVFATSSLGNIYMNYNEYEKAFDVLLDLKNYMNEKGMTDRIEYVKALDYLGDISKINKNAENMVSFYDSAIKTRNDLNMKDEVYINENLLLGKYFLNKDSKKALEYLSEASIITNENNGDSKEYASILMDIGQIYCKLNENDKAIGMFNKAKDVFKTRLGEKSVEYLKSLGSLSDIEYKNGNIDVALNLYEELYNAGNSEIFTKDRKENLVNIYKNKKDYKKLIKFKLGR